MAKDRRPTVPAEGAAPAESPVPKEDGEVLEQ